jgi:hypothetical protein
LGLTETSPRIDAALHLVRGFWAAARISGEANPERK